MIIRFIRNLILRYGFGHTAQGGFPVGSDNWKDAEFFTAHRAKTLRLAEIARERSALKDRLQKAIAQKKERGSIYQALRALSVEELNIESGK